MGAPVFKEGASLRLYARSAAPTAGAPHSNHGEGGGQSGHTFSMSSGSRVPSTCTCSSACGTGGVSGVEQQVRTQAEPGRECEGHDAPGPAPTITAACPPPRPSCCLHLGKHGNEVADGRTVGLVRDAARPAGGQGAPPSGVPRVVRWSATTVPEAANAPWAGASTRPCHQYHSHCMLGAPGGGRPL